MPSVPSLVASGENAPPQPIRNSLLPILVRHMLGTRPNVTLIIKALNEERRVATLLKVHSPRACAAEQAIAA